MKELRRATKIFIGFMFLVAAVSVMLAFVPVRQRAVDIPKGFYYGGANNQTATYENATFVRKWYGFPATVAEKELVEYQSGDYESATYDIQKFSWFYTAVNIIFWTGLVAALLAPVTIFYRPKKKSNEVKITEGKNESQVKQTHANTRD